MLLNKCSKRSAMNSSTRSTDQSARRRMALSLPLPLGEGWGEGVVTERLSAADGGKRGRKLFPVLSCALTLPSPKGRGISDIKFRPTFRRKGYSPCRV